MDKVLRPDPEKTGWASAPLQTSSDPSRTPALVLDHLSQTYGAIVALDRVSLAIGAGEVLAVLGHSGSGKSTLLRLIAGLERPASGRIAFGAREVSGPATFVPPEERGVGMMFQDYALFPHLSVLRNVTFGLNKLPASEATGIALAALDRVGLRPRADDYPHKLSGGEQQRVALARALVPRPRILLMDEPFSNLDRRTRDQIRDETAAVLREYGATAIFVTHDPDDAMRMADRILLMSAGRIVQLGTPEELYRQPASLLVARFFSDFNEIDGVCRQNRVATPIGDFPVTGMAEGARVTVCIRTDAIRIGRRSASTRVGRVIALNFLGESRIVTIAVAGLARPLQVRAPLDASVTVAEDAVIDLDHADALVFPALPTD